MGGGSWWAKKIGDGFGATTLTPEIYNISPEHFKSEEKFVLCDCPGFGDTRTKEEKLLTIISTQLVAKAAKSIRAIVVVIEFSTIKSGNATNFRELINILKKVMKDYNKAKDSILFVITKKPKLKKEELIEIISNIKSNEEINITTLKSDLEKIPEDVKKAEELRDKEELVNILQSMTDNSKNLIIADVLNKETKKEIFNRLKNQDFFSIPKNEFDFGKSDENRMEFSRFLENMYEIAIQKLDLLHDLKAQVKNYETQQAISNQAMEINTSMEKLRATLSSGHKVDLSPIRKALAECNIKKDLLLKEKPSLEKSRDILAYYINTNNKDEKDGDDGLETCYEKEYEGKKVWFLAWNKYSFSYLNPEVPIQEIQTELKHGKLYNTMVDEKNGLYSSDFKSNYGRKGYARIVLKAFKKDIHAKEIGTSKTELELKIKELAELEVSLTTIEAHIQSFEKVLFIVETYEDTWNKEKKKKSQVKSTEEKKDEVGMNQQLQEVQEKLSGFYKDHDALKVTLLQLNSSLQKIKAEIEIERPSWDAISTISVYINPDSSYFIRFNKKYQEYKESLKLPEDINLDESIGGVTKIIDLDLQVKKIKTKKIEQNDNDDLAKLKKHFQSKIDELEKIKKYQEEEIRILRKELEGYQGSIKPKNPIRHLSLVDLSSWQFSELPSNGHKIIDKNLGENGLYRGRASPIGNNCLLDTYFQQIQFFLKEKYPLLKFEDLNNFISYVREKVGKPEEQMLDANDEVEGVKLLKAMQDYLNEKYQIKVSFDLTIIVTDREGGIGIVDNAYEIQNQISQEETIIPLRVIQINYNHYEPLYLLESKKINKTSYLLEFINKKEKPLIVEPGVPGEKNPKQPASLLEQIRFFDSQSLNKVDIKTVEEIHKKRSSENVSEGDGNVMEILRREMEKRRKVIGNERTGIKKEGNQYNIHDYHASDIEEWLDEDESSKLLTKN